MNLMSRQFTHFAAIAEAGSLNKAAMDLGQTQSALTRSLKQLEERMETRLMQRGPRGSVLTPEGAILLECYRRVTLETNLALQSISHQSQSERFRIRIGSAPAFGLSVLPRAIGQFRKDFPDVRFEIHHSPPRTLFSQLEASEIEIYVGPVATLGESKAFETKPLVAVNSQVFAHKDHPLARKKVVTLSDLLDFPWVSLPNLSDLTLPGNWYDKLHRYAYDHGRRPPVVDVETTSVVSSLCLIENSEHLVCLSNLMREEAKVRNLVPLSLVEPLTEHLSGLAYRPAILTSRLYSAFIDTLSDVVADLGNSSLKAL